MKNYYIFQEGSFWICEVCIGEEVLDRFTGDTPTKSLENALKSTEHR